ncbi:MAG: hypothetical protein KKD69_07605 [Euryarchaeota archaeon]|nr:hypothetical protein [Euryarchaeota archaeon]
MANKRCSYLALPSAAPKSQVGTSDTLGTLYAIGKRDKMKQFNANKEMTLGVG